MMSTTQYVSIIMYTLLSFVCIITCQETDYDVIIMGGGMAGITAAKVLYEANITNILIIEAQDYIGGGMKTIEFEDYTLNGGASWIHGACIDNIYTKCSHDGHEPLSINPMLELANKYNITYVLSDFNNELIIDFGGNQHNLTNSDNTYNKLSSARDCAENIISNITNNNKIDDMSYFAALYLCGWKAPFSSIDKTLEFNNIAFEYATKPEWVSTYGLGFEYTHQQFGNHNHFITDPRGYQGIIMGMAAEFLNVSDLDNEPKIRLNEPITSIEYDENGVKVTVDDGDQYTAKYGIVTFSLGVLQSGIVDFVPELPDWKRNALMKYHFADYVAIYVKWPHNFWDSQLVDNTEIILLNDDRYGFFTWILNLDHPKYLNGSLLWRFDVTSDVAELVEFRSINDTIELIMDLELRHYFKDDLPDPVDIFVGDWAVNEYIQGSYSNWPIGVDDDVINAMNWHINNRLFFAGEAMWEDEGYVHSAYFSGNETANEILSCMGCGLNETNGIECRDEYFESKEDEDDCVKSEDDIWVRFEWLWIGIGFVGGILLGCVLGKQCKIRGDGEDRVGGHDTTDDDYD